MKLSLSAKLARKAQAAMTAAVEIYNKPSFIYRDETFATLASNAWELLLKARIVATSGNKPKSIQVFEPLVRKDGSPSKRKRVVLNGSGNPKTVTLSDCIRLLRKDLQTKLSPAIAGNIFALQAIRNNACHYINVNPAIEKEIFGIGVASVKNFIITAKRWFVLDFSKGLSIGFPISFIPGQIEGEVVVTTPNEKKLLERLRSLAARPNPANSDLAVSLRIELKIEKSNSVDASKIQYSSDPDAVKVVLSEEDYKQKYPWDYAELNKRLKARYSSFKCNQNYHNVRKPLEADEKYAHVRYLDPGNSKSAKQRRYNPNILQELDKFYQKK